MRLHCSTDAATWLTPALEAARLDGRARSHGSMVTPGPDVKDALLHSSLQDSEGPVGLATNPVLIGILVFVHLCYCACSDCFNICILASLVHLLYPSSLGSRRSPYRICFYGDTRANYGVALQTKHCSCAFLTSAFAL